MNLVCHIGTPKTGSTYLQNTLQGNAEWFLARGILYPDLLSPLSNHVTLFYAASRTLDPSAVAYGLESMEAVAGFRSQLSDHIARQIAAAPAHVHTMVMSSENLTGNMGYHDVLQLADLLKPLFSDIRIVVYLRRQDAAILSMYSEFMRRGYTDQSFEDFLSEAVKTEATPPYIQYRRLLEYWQEAFGTEAIRVHLYDRRQMIGGDILQDFLVRLFGEPLRDLRGLVLSQEDNRSLSAPAIEFLRRMQPYIPFYAGEGVNMLRQALEERINRLPDGPRPQISQEQSDRVLARFGPGNDWVQKTFLPDHPGPLFEPPRGLPEVSNLGLLSESEAAMLAAHLLTDGAIVKATA